MHPTDQPKTFVYLHIHMGTINVVKYVNCQLCMHDEQTFRKNFQINLSINSIVDSTNDQFYITGMSDLWNCF